MTGAVEELQAKRGELQARREALLIEARGLEADLATVDRCIALLDPSVRPAEPMPRKAKSRRALPACFENGEFSVLVANALRDASRPMDTSGLAAAILRAKGIHADTLKPADLTSRVSATLNHFLKRNRVRQVTPVNGGRPLWEVARQPVRPQEGAG